MEKEKRALSALADANLRSVYFIPSGNEAARTLVTRIWQSDPQRGIQLSESEMLALQDILFIYAENESLRHGGH